MANVQISRDPFGPLTARQLASLKRKVETALRNANNIHGRGEIVAVVWGGPYAGRDQSMRGVAVRQMQYGMDSVEFKVASDWKTVRFLQKQRVVV